MTLSRYAKKRDSVEPEIITALERAGWHVWQLDTPCDLLCWLPSLGAGNFKLLEVKTPYGKNQRVAKDKRQQAQENFIRSTGTPVVRTPLEALKALGVVT